MDRDAIVHGDRECVEALLTGLYPQPVCVTRTVSKQEVRPRRAMERFVLLLAPYAPHIAEGLWQILGRGTTPAYEPRPEFDVSGVARFEPDARLTTKVAACGAQSG